MQKVKEQSKATSIFVSCEERTSKVIVVVTAMTVEAKSLARKLVEEEMSKSLAILVTKNKLQKQKKPSEEDEALDTPIPSPTKMKSKTASPEASRAAVAPPAGPGRGPGGANATQLALSSSSATQQKVIEKGKAKTDGMSVLLRAIKDLPQEVSPNDHSQLPCCYSAS